MRDAPPPDPAACCVAYPFGESLPSAPQLRADATLRRRAGKAARRSRTDPSCCSAEPFLMKKREKEAGRRGKGGGGGARLAPFFPAALSFVVLNAWVPRGTHGPAPPLIFIAIVGETMSLTFSSFANTPILVTVSLYLTVSFSAN